MTVKNLKIGLLVILSWIHYCLFVWCLSCPLLNYRLFMLTQIVYTKDIGGPLELPNVDWRKEHNVLPISRDSTVMRNFHSILIQAINQFYVNKYKKQLMSPLHNNNWAIIKSYLYCLNEKEENNLSCRKRVIDNGKSHQDNMQLILHRLSSVFDYTKDPFVGASTLLTISPLLCVTYFLLPKVKSKRNEM